MRELKKHYIEYHDDFELKHEKHVFNTDEGFKEWKKEEEIRTKSSFVKRGGAKKVTNKQFTYYLGKLNLHGNDRRNLAALLKAGVQSTKIIEDIQIKCLPTERLGLLTKKDLHNVYKMQRGSYNPILEYKPVGSALTNNPLDQKTGFHSLHIEGSAVGTDGNIWQKYYYD
ncbi:hypothetical protein TNCV_3181731 [Trichonephila clavipes]|nr:hypothetical protein TNCV_3181731 [Trichonephila clavipes]